MIFRKVPHGNGHMNVYLFGIKIASYKPKQFVNGKNNKISISGNADVKYSIFGNNNKIVIKDSLYPAHINICIGSTIVNCNNCLVSVGKNVSIGDLSFVTPIEEDGMDVEIGDNCMISVGVRFLPSDSHAMLDMDGNIKNIAKHIKIGNHVWLGANVTICKNTEIADGCVVGTQSVVSGKFTEPNCVIAGNPARVVKRNIQWDRRKPKTFLQK